MLIKPICIFHSNCADGFTAAWAVWKRLGDSCEFYPGVYQEPPPDVTGRDVIMVDFSYKRPVLEAMCQPRGARSMLILDHHKSAAADLDELGSPLLGEDATFDAFLAANILVGESARVMKVFDMERSGAGIAWDFFHRQPRPRLVDFVEDRDLWRFELEGSREVNAVIFSTDYDFFAWEGLNLRLQMTPRAVMAEGAAIERKHNKDVRELLKVTRGSMIIGGYDVPAANLPYTYASDAAGEMSEGEPFAACYWDTPAGRVFSLRSKETGIDVSEIAKLYGGGGHKHAAGFRVLPGQAPIFGIRQR